MSHFNAKMYQIQFHRPRPCLVSLQWWIEVGVLPREGSRGEENGGRKGREWYPKGWFTPPCSKSRKIPCFTPDHYSQLGVAWWLSPTSTGIGLSCCNLSPTWPPKRSCRTRVQNKWLVGCQFVSVCDFSSPRMHQNQLLLVLCSGPTWELTALPRPP